VPGLEFAGVVDAVGTGVSAFEPGQSVFGLTRFGGYATAATVDARFLAHTPPGWSAGEAASYPVQALTAWYAICELGACPRGGTVLVHSAGGGVGLNALEILGALDARVVATVGHADKAAWLAETCGLAPAAIIVRDPRRFLAQLDDALAAVGRPGFDVVLDSVAGPYFFPAYRRLRPAGRHVIFGSADMMPSGTRPNWFTLAWRFLRRPMLDPMRMISANRSVMGFNLIWLWEEADRLPPAYAALSALIRRPPRVGRTFAFDEAPAAMRFLQSGRSTGKVVLIVPEAPRG
jgi:alcohol dehydrogenase